MDLTLLSLSTKVFEFEFSLSVSVPPLSVPPSLQKVQSNPINQSVIIFLISQCEGPVSFLIFIIFTPGSHKDLSVN